MEVESYTPPVIAFEHEESVFFAEPFAERGEFESRYIFFFLIIICDVLLSFFVTSICGIAQWFAVWETIARLINGF